MDSVNTDRHHTPSLPPSFPSTSPFTFLSTSSTGYTTRDQRLQIQTLRDVDLKY